MSKKKIVVVLGMHRSGTSAIARGLKVLGVDLGDNLMRAVPGNNDKGFFEDLDVFRLNERILARLGSAWDRMDLFEPQALVSDGFSAERRAAATLIDRKMASAPVFGLKDPRISILLPFWKCVFDDLGLETNYIVAIRNPFEVAESLIKRDGFDPLHGISLWMKYTWTSLQDTAESNRIGLSYARLMQDPLQQLIRAAGAFDLPPPTTTSPEFVEFANVFLSADLRHNRILDKEVFRSQSIPPIVPELYERLLAWSDALPDEQLTISQKTRARIDAFWMSSRPILALSDRLRETGDALRQKADTTEKSRLSLKVYAEQLQERLRERDKLIAELGASIEAQKHLTAAAEAGTRISEANLETANARIAAVQAEADAERQAAAFAEEQRADIEQKHVEQIASLEARTADLALQIGDLNQKLAEAAAAEQKSRTAFEQLQHDCSAAVQQRQAIQAQLEASLRDAKAADDLHVKARAESEQRYESLLLEERAHVVRLEGELAASELAWNSRLDMIHTSSAADLEALNQAHTKSVQDLEAQLRHEKAHSKTREAELVRELEAVRSSSTAKVAEEQEVAARLAAELTALRSGTDRTIEELRAQLALAREASEYAQASIMEEKELTTRLAAELAALRSGTSQTIEELQAQLALAREASEYAQASIMEEKELTTRLAAELAALRSGTSQTIEELETQLSQSREAKARAESRIAEEMEGARRLASELAEVRADAVRVVKILETQLAQEREAKERAEAEARRITSAMKARQLASEELNIQGVSERIASATGKLALQYEGQVAALKAELVEKSKAARLLRREILDLRSSTSWRVTRPVRALRTWLTRLARPNKYNASQRGSSDQPPGEQ